MPAALTVPSRAWVAVLVGLAGVLGGWSLLPSGPAVELAVVLAAAAATGALVLGRGHGVTGRLWRTLAVSQALVVLGWTLWLLLPHVLSSTLRGPDAGDAFFVGAYAIQVVVVAGLSRANGADRSSVLDAAVLGTSTGVVMWTLVLGPAAEAHAVPLAARLVSLAYPLLDVLLLAAAVPLVLARTRTTRSLLLLGWVVTQLAGDVVHARQVASGGLDGAALAALLFVASYGLLAAAALHPSPTGAAGTAQWWRRAVLGAAVLPLPVLLVVRVVQGSARDVALIAAATLLLTLLVVARTVAGDGGLPPAAEHAVRRTVLRFGVCLLAFAILPLVSLTALGVGQARSAVQDEVERRLQATAATGAAHVEDQLRLLSELVASYADRPTFVAAAAATGPAADAVLSRQLLELQGRGDQYVGAWLVDARGVLRTFAPSLPSAYGVDLSTRDYFTGVVRTRGPYVSEAFATALPGAPQVVALAAPVQRNGELLGVVALGYRLEALDALASRIGGAQGTLLTLTDRRGTVLSGAARRPGRLVSVAETPGVAAALAGRSGFAVPAHRDSGTWRAYAPLGTTGGALLAEVPAATAYASVHRLTGRMVAAATLIAQVLLVGLVLQAQVERRRRGAESLLASREGQVREILAAAGDAFLTFDSTGRVLRWNRAAEEVFGCSADEALGRSVLQLCIPPQDRVVRADALRRTVASGGGGGSSLVMDGLRSDGTVFPVEGTLWSTLVDGRLTFNAFVRDVTGRREQEAALAAARDEALRSSRIKSEFVANMSHEIRTPMNGVVGMTSLLLDTPLDDRQRDFVRTLRGSADALLTVLNDVLDFSKIEAGKLDIEHADFAVTTLAEDVVELLSGAARAKGLEIAAVVDPALPDALRGDAHRLRQVLTNLVGNAVKFTESGEVVLTVGAQGPAVDGVVPVVLSVRDTGVGHPRAPPAAAVRGVHAGRRLDDAAARRHGARPDHQPAAGRADGRHPDRRERGRSGQHVHGPAGPRGGRAGRRPRGRRPRRRARARRRRLGHQPHRPRAPARALVGRGDVGPGRHRRAGRAARRGSCRPAVRAGAARREDARHRRGGRRRGRRVRPRPGRPAGRAAQLGRRPR